MSSRELIVRYVRERARPMIFVPLALAMVGTDWLSGARRPSAIAFLLAAPTALSFVLAFRVWDDLEDRARDAHEHPRRVTVLADSATPLIALSLSLAAFGALLVVLGPRPAVRLGAAAGAAAILWLWYRLRRASAHGVVNGHVVLLKYPALAFAASPVAPPPAALLSLYLLLCVHEIVDDPALRASLVARRIAISECALVSAIILTATLLGGRLP